MNAMRDLLDDLALLWREVEDLRRVNRERGGRWSEQDVTTHDKLVEDIGDIVARLPSAWTAWKESI
jgi:hypothetical protein